MSVGLYARIGERNTTNFTILANDYPSGSFRVDEMRSINELAEDYNKGDEEITSGMIFVSRDMGTIYNVSVSGPL